LERKFRTLKIARYGTPKSLKWATAYNSKRQLRNKTRGAQRLAGQDEKKCIGM